MRDSPAESGTVDKYVLQKRSGGDSSSVSKEKKPEEGGGGGKDAGELFWRSNQLPQTRQGLRSIRHALRMRMPTLFYACVHVDTATCKDWRARGVEYAVHLRVFSDGSARAWAFTGNTKKEIARTGGCFISYLCKQ